MIKKAIFLLMTLLPFWATAQQSVGGWKQYPLYNGNPSQIVVTDPVTYFVSTGCLYSYNPSTEELIDYSSRLSSNNIIKMAYNNDKGFLCIAYTDGNIDLLHDDGTVDNLCDIKDAALGYPKTITDVDFDGSTMYVATNFGLVVFDTDKKVVKQSGIYGKEKPVANVMACGDYVVINRDNRFYTMKKGGMINRLENFNRFEDQIFYGEMHAFKKGKDRIIAVGLKNGKNDNVRTVQMNFADNTFQVLNCYPCDATVNLSNGIDGYYYTYSNNLHRLTVDDVHTTIAPIPSTLADHIFSTRKGATDLWAANTDGIGLYDISDGGLTVKCDKMKPDMSLLVKKVAYLTPTADGKGFFISNLTSGLSGFSLAFDSNYSYQATNLYKNGNVTDVTCNEVKSKNFNNTSTTQLLRTGPIAQDPFNENRYYIGTSNNGVYVVENGKEIATFYPYAENPTAPFPEPWGARANAVSFDRDNNLWVMTSTGDDYPAYVLPAAKVKDPAKVVSSDWVKIKVPNFCGHQGGKFVYSTDKKHAFFFCGQASEGVVFYDFAGTISNIADDKYVEENTLVDQDGKKNEFSYIKAICLDNNGELWIGGEGTSCVMRVINPEKYIEGAATVIRPKVPRNDGTNFADYLLDGDVVTDIAVDANNNKWIATKNSGVYLVNATGEEILAHFTSDNSPLIDNVVTCVFPDPNSNSVFIGTNNGLFEYSSMSSPSRDDYSEVYAYPNPVQPGFTGWITINGLMENSLVKIADAAGNVVYTGRSDGGMMVWDGCNSAGARVKSGVYYVFASQSANGSSSGAVTKILILN